MKKLLLILAVPLLFACREEYGRDFDVQKNFDALWKILDEKYCFFEAKNIDWQQIRDIYEPRLKDIENYEVGMFDFFAQMLDTLQDGHVNLYAPFDISRCKGWFADYPENFDANIIYSNYLKDDYRISGGFQYNAIDRGRIGYIRYASFENAISASGMNYIKAFFKNGKGLIIDVRNNGGGSLGYSSSFAACFFKEKTLTGYIRHKTGVGHGDFSEPQPIYTNPSEKIYDWSDFKVVILTNRKCYSATNEFICRVKSAPNVTVIGGITGGGGGIPSSNELPCGWLVRFSSVQLMDKNKNQIEFGIEPEINVALLQEDVAEGRDTMIEYAVNLLSN
jgi:hypothetical protein